MGLPQPQEYTQVTYPMVNKGMVTKADPSLLREVYYQKLINMTSVQEGALRSRNGYQQLVTSISGTSGILNYIHSMVRLSTGDPAFDKNFLYVGEGEEVYRMTSEIPPVIVPSTDTGQVYAAQLATLPRTRRFSGQAYSKTASGKPYMYLASSGRMKKDPLDDTKDGNYNEMQKWGIDPPVWPAQADLGGGGNLDSVISKYNYIYTLRNPITGHEGNPSVPMLDSLEIDTLGTPSQIIVRIRAHSPEEATNNALDLQVSGKQTLVLYRKGGSFSDGFYRRVAFLDEVGPDTEVVFTDDVPDALIAGKPTVDFDNDRPVTANLPIPFFATILSTNVLEAGTGGAGIPGEVEVTIDEVTQGFAPNQTDLNQILRMGTRIRVGDGTDTEETCVVGAITSNLAPYKFVTCFQQTHAAAEVIATGSIANQGCPLSAQAFNSIFLAGDANNTNILHKSKAGRPEAFPIVNLANGAPGSIAVGTPSDPIMNLCEFNGEVICLNRSHLYLVRVWNDYMQTPIKTPAQRGLFARYGWVKADNEIWYVAYDGVYSWSGGQSTKRSEAIDPIFKGEYFNGFYPIDFDDGNPDAHDFSSRDKIEMEYYKNEIFLTYVDTDGTKQKLRYHQLYDRWSVDTTSPNAMMLEEDTGRLLFTDNPSDIGELYWDDTPVSEGDPSTSDAWAATPGDGTDISWEAWTGWFTMGLPSMQKQFGDILVELQNTHHTVTVEVYYDFSPTVSETFTIAANLVEPYRRRAVLPIESAAAKEAYAVSLRFTGSGNVPVTFHSLTFHFLTLEQIQRGRATDWDNLSHPHDKKLTQVSLEYDVAGTDITLNLDIMNGIGGATLTQAVQTFTLSSPAATASTGPLRARTTFPINDGIIAKLVRLRETETAHDVKRWTYNFDFIPYPPDKVLFTEWDELGYPCEKVPRELVLEVDTGGVDAEVNVQADSITKRTFSVRTTNDDRHLILNMDRHGDREIRGRRLRLLNIPGTGGKFQLFSHQFVNAVREPCPTIFWRSTEQAFAYNGFRWIKQIFLEYRSCSGLTVRVYSTNEELLHIKELTRHDYRSVERFYLPPVSGDGVLNKSKVHSFTIESCDPCCPAYLYHDASRVEWMPVGADMRQGYQQSPLFEPIERTLMP